ncbi:flagellar biosynthetic protein FliR [Marinibaculum pumilum]|uniref:Flagellar biosynthetic protein FliR n=1 Tax=Marinibaculum pumilum TaxID=1766165 RepID=A0ABV7KYG8_9PROT
MLDEILPGGVFAFMLVFMRVGGALLLMPAIGEVFIPVRIRLFIAFGICLALTPVVGPQLPALPATPLELFLLLAVEILVGVFLGAVARILFGAMNTAGTIIAYQTGLGFAQFYDPSQGTQSALVSSFLTMIGLTILFTSGLHYVLLEAIRDSYILFPVGRMPDLSGFAEIATTFVAESFRIGLQIAAPFLVYGLVFYAALGILTRLIPRMQIFFIALPIQLVSGFVLLAVTLTIAFDWFLDHVQSNMAEFLVTP